MRKFFFLLLLVILLNDIGKTAELTGRFLYNGEPVSGLSVFAISDGNELTGFEPRSITDSKGVYYFSDLEEGTYILRTFGEHSNTYYCTLKEFWGSSTDVLELKKDVRYRLNDLNLYKKFEVIAPFNGQVLSKSAPIFKWESFLEADHFKLQIYDVDGNMIYESPNLYSTEFQGPVLDEGIYSWQVNAYNHKNQKIAMTPFSKRRRLFTIGNPGVEPILLSVAIGPDLKNGELTEQRDIFLTDEEKVVVLLKWGHIEGKHTLVYKFFAPNGEKYHELPYILKSGQKYSYVWLDIRYHRMEELKGIWRLEVWVDGKNIRNLNFTIKRGDKSD
ncbi:hypothetical protein BBF96_12335 [Anoxybacter fermentans]|uniref:Carboxypeptidase regulatory-like domain-containing protein n=1 Tax=Anoxybacter fermentans TaxID=1323375 RepID=A0A3Q9HS66_9FIRM|nr:hypothetical protein [Anoxybacter fermentans]AZR74117.1 hypothetical protein BBF96_12335 [Anoxybacter fermentans]